MPYSPASAPPGAVVKKTLLLHCSRDHAFRVFTQNMGRWWPATHHVGDVPFRDILIEPRTGGRWYEISVENAEGMWGHVLKWDPPHRLMLSWHLGPTFAFNPDLARASELDISFHALGADEVRVEFEHRHIERHGEGYEKLRERLDGGWVGVLAEFAKLADPAALVAPANAAPGNAAPGNAA
jgi:uncharacterized protein YndB with AHSA1/START domain